MRRVYFVRNLSYHLRLQIIIYFLTAQSTMVKSVLASGETNGFLDSSYSLVKEAAVANHQLDELELYLKGINGSLNITSLEYMLDFYDKDLLNMYDFDPLVIVKNLVEVAQSHNATPEQFQEDIKDLIVLHSRLTSQPKIPYISTLKSDIVMRKTRESHLTNETGLHEPHVTESRGSRNWANDTLNFEVQSGDTSEEDWVKEMRLLEKRYNVSPELEDSNSLTHPRLALMFPHHGVFGTLNLMSRMHDCQSLPCSIYHDSNLKSHQETVFPPPSKIFQRPEFGGLIPRLGFLRGDVRRAIIAVHLQSSTRLSDSKAELVPFRAQSVLLKWRIERSLLSDERRVRLLQNYDVITESRELRTAVKEAYAEVSEDVRSAISWRLLETR